MRISGGVLYLNLNLMLNEILQVCVCVCVGTVLEAIHTTSTVTKENLSTCLRYTTFPLPK